jgi:hypothetical protein
MAKTYEPIATQTVVGSSTGTITFTSIPATYTDIIVVINAGYATDSRDVTWQVNNDTGSNYSNQSLQGDGTSVTASRSNNQVKFYSNCLGYPNAGIGIIHLMNYANTTTYKTALSRNGSTTNPVQAAAHLWRSTAAINRLDFFPNVSGNFANGSTFTLYGIASA